MKINRVYIHAFGKLSRYERIFTDGFNLVYGDNEYGKTTLMAFIKMMFYGTPNNAAGRAEREHYMPWSGEKCEGYIDFELNGINYRLTREFAATNSGDKITLEKSEDGKPEKISPRDNLGEKIFGCSLDCFERSLFIGNLNDAVTGKEALGELNSRLSNLVSTGEEDISAKIVTDRLTKAKHTFMSRGGKIGIYDKGAARLADLKNDLIEVREKYAGKTVLENQVKRLKNELESEKEKIKNLSSIFAQSEKITRALNLKEFIAAANDLDRKAQLITCKNGELLNTEHIDSLRAKKLEIHGIEDAINDLQAQILEIQELAATDGEGASSERIDITKQIMHLEEQLSIIDAQISRDESSTEAAAQSGFKVISSAAPIILGILGAALIAGAVFAYFLIGTLLCGLLGVTGVACTAVSVCLQSSAKKRARALRESFLSAREELVLKKTKRQELKNNIDALERRREQINSLEQTALATANARQQLFEQKREELSRLKEKLNLKKSELDEFLIYLPDRDADNLAERLRIYSSASATLAYIGETVGCDVAAAKAELEEYGELPKSIPESGELRASINDAQGRASDIHSEILRLESEIKTRYHELAVPAQLEHEIAELFATLEAQKSFCDSIDIALEVLEQSGDELRRTWGSELNGKVKDIFSLLTGGRYTQAYVTKELQMTAVQEDTYAKRFVEHLSAGTRDQAYFSLRLAVCELLFDESGSMPVFLDDVFERYDDTRARRGIEFLKKYAKDRQVIFFTCHEAFKKM